MRYNYYYLTTWEASASKEEAIRTQAMVCAQRDFYFGVALLYIGLIRFWRSPTVKTLPIFQLKRPLMMWNLGLAIFSWIGTIRFVPDFFVSLQYEGIVHTVCSDDFYSYVPLRWAYLFLVSKVLELGDTVFLMLRHKPIMFLHWYHHVTVLLGTWHGASTMSSLARPCTAMNYMVHSLMYTYYFLRAKGYRIPRAVAMIVTSAQIFQMFVGCAVVAVAFGSKVNPQVGCDGAPWESIAVAAGMYSTYLVLFLRYFAQAYLVPSTIQGDKKSKAKKD